MKLGTFCSGIGAPEVAGMGKPIWAADLEPFPNAVRAYRMPGLPNLGDITAPDIIDRITEIGLPDIVVAGLPCQPFSVAGLRRGEEDPRNLTVRFVEIANAIDDLRRSRGEPPVWWLVENVPGLLSDKANAFGALLGGLVGHDTALDASERGGWTNAGVVDGPRRCAAWRVLDAQHFGVAQRRRRVFVLARGGAGAWAVADALLPVIDSMSWHPPPRRGEGAAVAALTARGVGTCGADDNQGQAGHLIAAYGGNNTAGPIDIATALNACGSASGRQDFETETLVCHGTQDPDVLRDTAHPLGRNQGQENAVTAFDTTQITSASNYSAPTPGDPCHPLAAGAHAPAVCVTGCTTHALTAEVHDASEDGTGRGTPVAATPLLGAGVGTAVRRLTPVECERLQGFPDGYTRIPWRGKPAGECPDGPRYKALGNSMAVPVMAWIGRRIAYVNDMSLARADTEAVTAG